MFQSFVSSLFKNCGSFETDIDLLVCRFSNSVYKQDLQYFVAIFYPLNQSLRPSFEILHSSLEHIQEPGIKNLSIVKDYSYN